MFNKLLIDSEKLKFNTDYFAKLHPNCKIIAVIKDNAYGHGIKLATKILNENIHVSSFAVADVFEFQKIEKITKKPILIFKRLSNEELENMQKRNIHITIDNLKYLKKNHKMIQKFKWHLKINTGMNRNGIEPDQIPELMEFLERHQIKNIHGIFSHLYDANPNTINSISEQTEIFKQIYYQISDKINFEQVHLLASGGALLSSDELFTHIRPGLGLFGLSPFDTPYPQLKQVGKIVSYVYQIRTINFGSLGYGCKNTNMYGKKVAVIPIGYGYGISRCFTSSKVRINDRAYSIVGKICTDYFFVEVDETVEENSKVEIFTDYDTSNNPLINYEAFTLLNDRLIRIIYNEK
jgi:alanine racemase